MLNALNKNKWNLLFVAFLLLTLKMNMVVNRYDDKYRELSKADNYIVELEQMNDALIATNTLVRKESYECLEKTAIAKIVNQMSWYEDYARIIKYEYRK